MLPKYALDHSNEREHECNGIHYSINPARDVMSMCSADQNEVTPYVTKVPTQLCNLIKKKYPRLSLGEKLHV